MEAAAPTRYWHLREDGRVQCDLCPRRCSLRAGQRGLCFGRARRGDAIVLTTYGRSSGFAVDPIEKKPLFHFLPGSRVLSFGTAGCNLACRFCQNWDISKAKAETVLRVAAAPEQIAAEAARLGCSGVAFTYNDPVVFHEYAVDTARACRARGLAAVAVTAGYVSAAPREEFYAVVDAANIDLKSCDDAFYRRYCGGRLAPVLETLEYVARHTRTWLEVTTLLIPGLNDSPVEVATLSAWVAEHLGPDTPLHFSAFHPAFRMTDRPPTPAASLAAARRLARAEGLRFVYTGNIRDPEGQSTRCPRCGALLVGRDGYRLTARGLDDAGNCAACGVPCPGIFAGATPGDGRVAAPRR
ncbi:MAG: AmmeMemoRadiSam system radical SAM enzyme [Actinobacteria bacterium]|nr:AmmeMemoRadiSam system radical SAM enzyme [Actinomycetota bacterium]